MDEVEGTLLTTTTAKAHSFLAARAINDDMLAGLLGYPETKAEAVA